MAIIETLVHIRSKKGVIYCDNLKKGVDEWVKPQYSIEEDPSALRAHGGWENRAICLVCIQKAETLGDLKKKVLYCVLSWTKRTTREGKVEWVTAPLRYNHAVSETHARQVFFANHSPLMTRIIHIGRSIGFHVADKKGEVLFA